MNQEALAHLKHHLLLIKKILRADYAYVAGGALRDLDHDKPINDIDIFIGADDWHLQQAKLAKNVNTYRFSFAAVLDNIYGTTSRVLDQRHYGDTWPTGLRIHHIREIDHLPHKIQIIFYQHSGRRGPMALTNYFDIDLCKISYDGNKVYRRDEYKRDVRDRTITVNAPFARKERTLERAEKLKLKFDGFTPVIPTVSEDPYTMSQRIEDHIIDQMYYTLCGGSTTSTTTSTLW